MSNVLGSGSARGKPLVLLALVIGAVTQFQFAVLIVVILPLFQAGLIGTEFGLHQIFNSTDRASLSSFYGLEMPAGAPVAAAFFVTTFGSLTLLYTATSPRFVDRFAQSSWRTIGIVARRAIVILTTIELMSLLIWYLFGPASRNDLLLGGLLFGAALGGLCSALLFGAVASIVKRRVLGHTTIAQSLLDRHARMPWPRALLFAALAIMALIVIELISSLILAYLGGVTTDQLGLREVFLRTAVGSICSAIVVSALAVISRRRLLGNVANAGVKPFQWFTHAWKQEAAVFAGWSALGIAAIQLSGLYAVTVLWPLGGSGRKWYTLIGALQVLIAIAIVTGINKWRLHRLSRQNPVPLERSIRWVVPTFALTAAVLMDVAINAYALLTLLGLLVSYYMFYRRLTDAQRSLVVATLFVAFISAAFLANDGETLTSTRVLAKGEKVTKASVVTGVGCDDKYEPSDVGHGMSAASALNCWRRQMPGSRPKIIAIAASGGGYRATFWTSAVLDTIKTSAMEDGRLRNFARDTRFLTGASGGAVALAYMAILVDSGSWPSELISERIRRDIVMSAGADEAQAAPESETGSKQARRAIDSLQPILKSFVLHDLFSQFGIAPIFNWLRQNVFGLAPLVDRGIALERQWSTLSLPFSDLARAESQGLRPILMLSPTISEKGKPLIISNLQLESASTADSAEWQMLDPSLLTGVSVARAVRANASFPRISPQLPITPERRQHVTDAGFIDNLGVDVLVQLLSQPSIVKWVNDNDADIVVVQIRAFPRDRVQNKGEIGVDDNRECRWTEVSLPLDVWRIYFYLTSTVQSLLNAHTAGNIARADRQLNLLTRLYSPGRLKTVVFENAAQVSLSWYLTAPEQTCVIKQMGTPPNRLELERLAGFLDSQ